jgi:hypothetical protein
MVPHSRGLTLHCTRSKPLQITTRAVKRRDFKSGLMPLHSPLLRQSRLVSFPPLIDMLKFSGYSHCSEVKNCKKFCRCRRLLSAERTVTSLGSSLWHVQNQLVLRIEATLAAVCPSEYQWAQCAFKDSMTHEILQFASRIAFRCVLHRCGNQEIRC